MIDTQASRGGGGAHNRMLIKDEVIDGNGFKNVDNAFPLGDAGSGAASMKTHIIPIICILTCMLTKL